MDIMAIAEILINLKLGSKNHLSTLNNENLFNKMSTQEVIDITK